MIVAAIIASAVALGIMVIWLSPPVHTHSFHPRAGSQR